jgi:hypothetical protein
MAFTKVLFFPQLLDDCAAQSLAIEQIMATKRILIT